MSNIKLILTENKATPYRKQRVVGRLGDGGLTTIDVELLQSDGKTPYAVFSNHELIFVGTNAKGEYTDGVPEILDGQKGIIRYTFTKENFSVLKEFKRAYFQLTDAEGSRVTFQDFTVDVLNNSDIDQGQVTLYVRLLDQLLADFEKRFGNQSVDFEERFKVFLQAKDLQYQNIYQMYNDLVIKLDKLSKDTKSIQEMQAEILKSIEEHDVFTKQESSANVIYQVIGKEKAEITFRLDAKSEFVKVSSVGYTTLLSPTNVSWTPLTEEQLNNLSSLDGSLYSARDVAANYMKQLKYDCDILGFFKSLLGEKFFTIRGATTDSQKVEVLESLITDFTSNVYGYGSGGGINKLTHRNWNGTWTVSDSTAANEVTRIGQTIESTDTNWKKLINGGKISVLSNSEPTISPNYSTVNIDYLCLDVTIELSANEHFEYMIAANHIENIATEEEAEAGENNEKTMTPLRVFQAIAKWTKDKFVSRTENETVLGVKNFANGLQVGGNNVLTQNGEIRFVTNSTNNSSLKSGSIVFKRYGDDVDIYANFQVRASGDLTRDMNIVAESIVDDIFEPGENFSFFVGNETAQAVVKFVGKGIKAHSTLTKGIWYVGTASYKAKNKL
ncbi:BppU family phage baseplate upper protein [Enterococcus avium]|uniref:BppU family phage baseplate upper protein n=2 Tax=Enterococcus TaxID=1350 RepID=UPI00232DE1EB|nr:BppU family phage baseplate upper protein [Enterococcus avium]MDB1750591.1 BppU family phage baseplate upper protein [Enterococcus avium]MDB1754657.1 BppU family phage baseplate upper protein [Enterococcus avium]MDB1761781.1 BppU family phage baseplate upper protein [Enterococcus avium]